MEAADRQLAAARELEAFVDNEAGGPGLGWYRIVDNPSQAAHVMEEGKLAVILGIEVDYLFNCHSEGDLTEDELRKELDRYYDLGVRHLYPIHFSNNGFGGTAYQNLLELADGDLAKIPPGPISNAIRNQLSKRLYHVEVEDGTASGYEARGGRKNVLGLTTLGRTLIREMIARGMIIDVDHMSAHTRAETLDICEENNYPVISGHTGFIDISNADKRHEGNLTAMEVERIRALGGMASIILHQGDFSQINTWAEPGKTVIEHTCGNTSNTLIQAYLYAVSKFHGAPIGFGTDLNGFAGMLGPRFGPDGSPGGHEGPAAQNPLVYNFIAVATGEELERSTIGQRTYDFNYDGVAHMGMLPDLIADWQARGLSEEDLEPLLKSADGYADMWARANRADGTLLREENGSIWVVFGGARFQVPDPAVLNKLCDAARVRQLWDGALDPIPVAHPADGTLLREENAQVVFRIGNGFKVATDIPPDDCPNILWAGGLAQVP